ncbi:DEAD/DEAH box helicase [Vibrio cincinnatiensis]|uniref:DEAD/DEAH box helicase n=1 Tax=Vibrio cincinnatiensis TaxID=675 RepID=UPI001EE04B03|nr:DEAD/DEAH box helicase family protein [Vibrio cincinnatiensis]MCG3726961.1 DEAD/DEAH box helicase [Vibrio cincinnatiensis]
MGTLKESLIGKSQRSWMPLVNEQLSPNDIHKSWCANNFIFKEENLGLKISGLRPPQIGGIYAALGYEKSEANGAATIVMPTGTGKTETILSIVIAGKFRRTLVIVPSDALREQTKNKFLTLGLLRPLGMINDSFENPIVTTLKSGIKDTVELDKLLDANVIIATAAALTQFSQNALKVLTQECSHLIVDEAHHVTAATWARIKTLFADKAIFQFTATPFRTDSSRVEGKIIFNYSLSKAQLDGYFKPIEFHPVKEFVEEKADKVIAQKAIELLKIDLTLGFDHIAMARANNIKRAEQVFEYYKHETELNPILITSKAKKKGEVIKAIKEGKHRIIVCVNMLGEGFDLPQLKISAIHDPHKSINVMLQFTGRFTRTTEGVGDAKFVANIANPKLNDCLQELYNEDSDWNSIISNISSDKVTSELTYQEFKAGFSEPSKLLDLGLTPSISTTVFSLKAVDWNPDNFYRFGNKQFQIHDSVISDKKDTLIFSVKSFTPVGWSSSKELFDESWDLYIAYVDVRNKLLFIHSSAKDGLVKRLVKLIAKGAIQINGERVFRALSGLKRLKLQNVGLNKNKKGLRYSMHTGTEINDQIPDIEAKRSIKSNIFGKGYEEGKLVSVGCSYKGKVWSMDSDSLEQWIDWCKKVGEKILDDSIDTNQVLRTAMQAEELTEYPVLRWLNVEWPIELLRKNDMKISLSNGQWEEILLNCELILSDKPFDNEKVRYFNISTPNGSYSVSSTITATGEVSYSTDEPLYLIIGNDKYKVADFFNENSPTFFLEDTSIIDGGYRYYSYEEYTYLYSLNNLEDWSWDDVDISVESQTHLKYENSIQYHTIQKIKDNYDLVFDDDGSGEVADIVAIKNNNDSELVIDLFHCKFCFKKKGVAKPGARIDDVYQVAGQAIKSTKWFANKGAMINRLIERERIRLSQEKASRIDKGNLELLINLSKIARYSSFRIGVAIVQPAISKVLITKDILSVLGATEAYIDEISGVKLKVIINQ